MSTVYYPLIQAHLNMHTGVQMLLDSIMNSIFFNNLLLVMSHLQAIVVAFTSFLEADQRQMERVG